MKFTVLLFIIFWTEIQAYSTKSWYAVGHKNESLCTVGWEGYLNRFFIVTGMLSGLILYYVPESRSYFRKVCHGIVDFVANGLKSALNLIDNDDYRTDYCNLISSDKIFKEPYRRKSLAAPILLKISENKKKYEEINLQGPEIQRFKKSDLIQKSLTFPSNSKSYISNIRNLEGTSKYNYDNLLVSKNVDHEEFVMVEDSEPTNYPEDESNYDFTESEMESEKNDIPLRSESYDGMKNQKILEKKFVEFDKKLKDLRRLFARKLMRVDVNKEEYASRLIDAILRSLKQTLGEDERKISQHDFRETRAIAVPRRAKKKFSSKERNQLLVTENSGIDESRVRSYQSASTKKKSRSSKFNSRSRRPGKKVSPASAEDSPIIEDYITPMLERAIRWFRGSCSGMKSQLPIADTNELRENNQSIHISGLWLR